MTTVNTDDSAVSHPMAADETKEQEKKKYPYLELLHQLQSISAAKFNTDVDDDDDENEDESDLKNNNTTKTSSKEEVEWDLSTDAQLATLLHEFTTHIQKRTYHVSTQIKNLQNSVNQVGVTVGLAQHDMMQMSNEICMEQVVGEDDDDDENDNGEGIHTNTHDDTNDNNHDNDDDDDDSSADIARLEAEEKAAIQNGMKALSLFFDPKRKRSSMQQQQQDNDEGIITTSDTTPEETNIVINTTITDGEENVIGENCYFYPAADADVFNSRPLPFIVGSREFMESSCGGEGEFDRIED